VSHQLALITSLPLTLLFIFRVWNTRTSYSLMQWLASASWEEVDSLWTKVVQNGFTTFSPRSEAPPGITDCIVSKYRPDTRGNIQVCIGRGSDKKHIIVHQLAYVKHNRTRLPGLEHAEVSHLCHRHSCCQINHLVLETRQANHSRKNCVGFVWSSKYQDWIPVCDHQPPCLTYKLRAGETIPNSKKRARIVIEDLTE
jgi:hypothetical protein